MFDQVIKTAESKPRNLFLIDGIGALVSAFSLGVVLVYFERFFGIPRSTLYFLAALPILFAIYDLCCYYLVKEQFRFYLRLIAISNILYCLLSIIMALFHLDVIEYLGWIYIIMEIILVLFIASIELRVANVRY